MQRKSPRCSRTFSKRTVANQSAGGSQRESTSFRAATQPVGTEGRALGVLSEEAMIVGKIKLTADVRTNRIHVVTRPINMPFIRRLIREFDANVEFGKPVTRYLRYVSAGDVLPVLVQALTEPGVEAGAATTGGGRQVRPRNRNNNGAQVPTGPGRHRTTGVRTGETGSTLNISEELATRASGHRSASGHDRKRQTHR